jgi:hypothetical protein
VLVDHRTYRFKPGTQQPYLDLYEKLGYAAQTRHLGKPLGYLYAESGDLNTIVHMWTYDDAADRTRKRAAMQADPEWQNYLKEMWGSGFLLEQNNRLMLPASFAPITR